MGDSLLISLAISATLSAASYGLNLLFSPKPRHRTEMMAMPEVYEGLPRRIDVHYADSVRVAGDVLWSTKGEAKPSVNCRNCGSNDTQEGACAYCGTRS